MWNVVRFWIYAGIAHLVQGVALGVLYRETTKYLDYSPAALHWKHYLALAHPHAIGLGTLMPLAFACCLPLFSSMSRYPLGPRRLWAQWGLFVVGSTLAGGASVYHGLHGFLLYRSGITDVAQAEALLFGGSRLVRGLVYGIGHGTLLISFLVFTWIAFQAMRRKYLVMGTAESPEESGSLGNAGAISGIWRPRPKVILPGVALDSPLMQPLARAVVSDRR